MQLVDAIEMRIRARANDKQPAVEVDMYQWMGRCALELIGQAGLGYSFDPLTADKPDAYAIAVKSLQFVFFGSCPILAILIVEL